MRSNATLCQAGRMSRPGLLFSLALVLSATGCGKIENPKDVSVLKLKPAMELQAIPGQESVTLTWMANNNEDDFSGYNIYMSTDDAAAVTGNLGVKSSSADPQRFDPIVFRDKEEDEIDGVRSLLSKHFNFDAATKSSKDPQDGKSFAPMARCTVEVTESDGQCVPVTDANKKHKANGLLKYTVDKLEPGRRYTFFVTATLDAGKKIVSPTSSILVATPHRSVSVPTDVTFKSEGESAGILDGLDLSVKASSPSLKKIGFSPSKEKLYCLAQGNDAQAATVDVYFQLVGGSLRQPTLTGANGARIADLGPVVDNTNTLIAGGLLESPYRLGQTALVPEVQGLQPSSTTPAANDVGAKGGYSRCGQSVLVLPYHLYAVAYAEGSQWRYALIETSGAQSLSQPSSYKVVVGNGSDRRL